MTKKIFRSHEVNILNSRKLINLTKEFEPPAELIEEDEAVVEQAVPDIEKLQAEAEAFIENFEAKKKTMLDNAQAEADEIIAEAKIAAEDEIKIKTEEADVITQKAQEDVKHILNEAEQKASEIISSAENAKETAVKEAEQKGFEHGQEKGFQKGKEEAERLIERLHMIIDRTIQRREQILLETEQQVVDLVLLMTRKVVKVISENQRNVVMANIVQALRKVKARGEVIIRVNLADLELTSKHTKDFLAAVENVENITIVEDSSVDRGGCIIETDFGAIDARIMSQLQQLEQKILEVSPMKSHIKSSEAPQKG